MGLNEAMHIVTETHTRDDWRIGFVVEIGAGPDSVTCRWSPSEYMEAWRVLREHLRLQTHPQPQEKK